MIKLLTLKNLSGFASDAVYKICLATERYGLSDESTETYDSYEDLLNAALYATEQGDYVVIAVENDHYNFIKRDVIGKLLLEEYQSEEIAELITVNAGEELTEIDITGHSIVPRGCLYHFTADGLFCGFSVDVLNGKLSYIPLDFTRIDTILDSLTLEVLEPLEAMERGERPRVRMPSADIEPCVKEMVENLIKADMKLALATGEATMWVYNLYDRVEGLTERINFVEVIDEEPSEEEETTTESESVRIIRHAREAMINSESPIGGAISEIYSTEDDEGNTVYFAYAAVVDRGSAKAKKINTSNIDDLGAILPHALTVLASVINNKAENQLRLKEESARHYEDEPSNDYTPEEEPEEKAFMSRNMLIAACAGLLVAVILPIILAVTLLKDNNEVPTSSNPIPNQPVNNSIFTPAPSASSVPQQTQPSQTTNPFASSSSSNNINPAVTESSAADIQASTTSVQQASTKGNFTFYVFGYGHGVGMSQVGANYLASQYGWSWADILAHYYYDANTSIVTGEIYPQKITYEGAQYDTREYLARALQAEMSPSSHIEALKAQVVAIYTFARYYNSQSVANASSVFTGELTSNSHAFLGGNETPAATIYAAVDAIMSIGPYISYNGTTALTPFHAMSAGKTTSYYNTWGKNIGANVPYLSGARTSLGDYYDNEFQSVVTITSEELKTLANTYGITLSGDPATWISIISHDGAVREDIGYVSSINVGGKVITGNEFRIKLLGGKIRSHCFAFTYTPTA